MLRSALRWRSVVSTPNAPKAIGPYSQAIKSNGFVFVSGMLGLNPKTMDWVHPNGAHDIKVQTEQALLNLTSVLEAAGCGPEHVVKTTILLNSIEDFAVVNDLYAKVFTKDPPARATFAVKTLPKYALIEIDAIAVDPAHNH